MDNNWFYDKTTRSWKVKLLNGTILSGGEYVRVRTDKGIKEGRVKQIAGFGYDERRPVISVVFGYDFTKRATKVLITDIIER